MTLKNHLPLLAGANCFCKGSCTCKQFLNQNVRAKEVPFAEALMDSLISAFTDSDARDRVQTRRTRF